MPDLEIGETTTMQGSGKDPYVIKRSDAIVYTCSCPAWRNQKTGVVRTCKHIRKLRGEAAEAARLQQGGAPVPVVTNAPVASQTATSRTADDSDRGNCMLAHNWDGDIDPKGWLMSEKYDGLRAVWDGKDFWSRQNAVTKKSNLFFAPDWFKAGMPNFPLDGELFLGRGRLQETISIVKTQDKSDRWKQIRYMVFDRPEHRDLTFEVRMMHLRGTQLPAHAEVVKHTVCTGEDHLRQELTRIESIGGEGLMINKPGALYELGRSHSILKVKSFFDAEATVVGHQAGKKGKTGNRLGTCGALECETHPMTVKVGGKQVTVPAGKKFKVGSGLNAKIWTNPPAVGTVITYRFFDLTKEEIPRNPTFVCIRGD